ncbi:hypothetical protein [Micromonospora sp. CPCC 205561]|uniref:hypothetical protein n=1 Tax=Micromonospora sp. CPCC 205561 TaxID=3122407 RepID=UPI002FF4145C
MPAPVARADKRNPQLLTVLFWVGVALAPVAALILLVADGNGPLRFAAVLAIVAVVLIGLSIALRVDGADPARNEELLDEIDRLRRELRGEIVAAAQRGNQALDEAQRAQEAVSALRRRLDASSAALAGVDEPAGAGRARVSADDAVAGRGGVPDHDDAAPRRGQDDAAHRRARDEREDAEPARRPQPVPRGERGTPGRADGYGAQRPTGGSAGAYAPRPAAAGAAGVYGAARPAEPGSEREARPLGVVRHTETVHVTTRHTIVDGAPSAPGERDARYGGGYAARWSPAPQERPWPAGADEGPWPGHGYGDPDDRPRRDDDPGPRRGDDGPWPASATARDDRPPRAGRPEDGGWSARRGQWSGQRDDRWDDHPGRGEAEGPARSAPAGQPGHGRSYRPDETGAESGEYWSQLRAGDRWAAVRDDERGRELRVGERRAEVHADATGTEYRVADRWASVRRDEPEGGPERADGGWHGGWPEPEGPPALPVGGVPVPDEWRPAREWEQRPDAGRPGAYRARRAEPEPERYGRRQEEQHGHPPRDEVPRQGGTRSVDRWR